MKVVRIKYAHSEPLFWRARLNVVEAGNLESARLIAEGVAEVGYVPITLAAELGLPVVPRLAIYSAGPMYSARLFAGRGGGGPCAVSETTVSAASLLNLWELALGKLTTRGAGWRSAPRC
ncbi:hypothetical protein [Pyrobaculum aerophilum]|uniref:hypothetical protein n=1 Tax=Pyrobaculum aerophilum TaxID=13773 RepID=UPI002690E006|nr:hypothetical protein [Pyrobaculum aerophilum]